MIAYDSIEKFSLVYYVKPIWRYLMMNLGTRAAELESIIDL